MNFKTVNLIHVYYMRNTEKLSFGRLALKDRKIYFEYDPQFLKTGLELSPFHLPLQASIFASKDPLFDGLFGIFNDSLPDGWGRLLLDRKLLKLDIHPAHLTPLDRLQFVGHHGMGALLYEPEIEGSTPLYHNDLDQIANEAYQFQMNDDDSFVDDLLAMNGSSAGARPKVMLGIDNEDWIIKFHSSIDPKDSGPIEYAYHLMAKAAKLEVPEARLFASKVCPGYFGAKRFDRLEGKRFHMHSISGLLQVDHRIPSLDYETIMKATMMLTRNASECEKQFRAAVFNVLTHNRDDHTKNFSFLMDVNGHWRVSPAYDLNFSSGPAGEHCTTFMGEGKNPSIQHLLKLADVSGIKKPQALFIIDEVIQAVSQWEIFARDANVGKNSTKTIVGTFKQIILDFKKI